MSRVIGLALAATLTAGPTMADGPYDRCLRHPTNYNRPAGLTPEKWCDLYANMIGACAAKGVSEASCTLDIALR